LKLSPWVLLLMLVISCSTEPETIHGCLDSQACNYNSSATIDNNSCEEFDCAGICGGNSFQVEGICCSSELDELDLSNLGLTSLPAEIGSLVNLTHLFLHNNNLTEIPVEIGNLANLDKLELSYNQLTELPSEIGNLTNLTHLGLTNNQLSILPIEIGNLTSLRDLWVSSNQLTELPLFLNQLVNLLILEIEDNFIQDISQEDIEDLINVTSINLGNNQISTIPPEIGNLINLTLLNLDSNQLTTLPSEIGNLTKLSYLSLRYNPISYLPESICTSSGLPIASQYGTDGILSIGLNLHSNNLCENLPSCFEVGYILDNPWAVISSVDHFLTALNCP
jgi:Leucine-rich repeat (LRR) protein